MAKKMIKSSRKTTKKLRKFEDGGMAGKGPLQPTPKKEKTVEELANETFSRLTTIPGVSKTETPTPKVSTPAPKAKLLPGGFKDQAQKDAYIKNTKNLLKTKSVADLVKMKHGTAAGLAALGFKDEVKKAAPVAKAPVANKTTANKAATKTPVAKTKNTTSTPSIKGLVQREKGRFLKEDGQELKAEGLKMKAQGQKLKQQAGITRFLKEKGKSQAVKADKSRGSAVPVDDFWASGIGGAAKVGIAGVAAAGTALLARQAGKQLAKAGTKAAVKVASKGVENIVKNSVKTNTLKGAVNRGGKSILNKSTQAVKQVTKPSTVSKIKSGVNSSISKVKNAASRTKNRLNDKYLDAIGQRKGGYGERGQYKRLKDLQASDKRRASYSGSN